METISNVEQVMKVLEVRGEGLIFTDEQPDGKMKYTVSTEAVCYGTYSTGAKSHAVNFSCSFAVVCGLGSHNQGALHRSE